MVDFTAIDDLSAEEARALRAELALAVKQSNGAGDALARFALHVVGVLLDKSAAQAAAEEAVSPRKPAGA